MCIICQKLFYLYYEKEQKKLYEQNSAAGASERSRYPVCTTYCLCKIKLQSLFFFFWQTATKQQTNY